MQYLKKYLSLLLKYAAPLGLFVLLPLLIALYLGHNIIESEKKQHLLKVSTQIENSLKDIESEISADSFLLKVARGAWFTYNNKQSDFWNYYNKLCDFLGTKPDFYIFDDKGSIVTPANITLKSRFLASKLWNLIDSTYSEKVKFLTRYKKEFKNFLGDEFRLGSFLESRNRLLPIIVKSKTGYVYWMNFPDNCKKGILIVFWTSPEFYLRLNSIINRYLTCFDYMFTRDFAGNIKHYTNTNLKNLDNESIFLHTSLMNQNNEYLDSSNGFLWKSVKLGNLWLLAALKSKSISYDIYHRYYTFVIIILAILSMSLYVFVINSKKIYLSIRIKLITLFLVAVFIPVMGFAYLGYQYINNMRDNLVSDFGNNSRDILLNIDRELGSSGNIFRDDFRKMVEDYKKYNENPDIRKKFAEILERQDLIAIESRMASDSSVISQIINEVVAEDINIVLDSLCKCSIDTILNTNLMDSLDPVLRAVLKSPESAFTSFAGRPDNVQDFSFGNLELYLYWCFTDSIKYGKEYFMIIRSTDKVLREYLKKRLEKSKKLVKERDFIIIARNDRTGEWFPNNCLLADNLKSITRRVNYMGKPIETEILLDSNKYLLLGLKSAKLRGYSFYALYPYKRIEKKINNIVCYIALAILLSALMAMAISHRLSETFIYPVKRLEDGVKAIEERNTEYRIESLQNDEFGGLALNFNKMIGNLKEMEVAKYIQESLLPKNLPKLNDYDISFSNTMASGVGGDYFDVALLDEDNLCIIIGDVSGHGVASALIMAIAKAIFYHGFKETKNLMDLFSDLNSVIVAYFFKPPVKKMITLFATIINLPSGEAVFLDYGHNFPMKISKDGEINELKMVGSPIGSLRKMKKKEAEKFTMEKGETIVFYTDGIIEATGKTSEQYGYERFKESLSNMANDNSESIMNGLINNYNQWKDGTEPDDDVTLVVLKRLSSQNNKCEIVS